MALLFAIASFDFNKCYQLKQEYIQSTNRQKFIIYRIYKKMPHGIFLLSNKNMTFFFMVKMNGATR